MSRVLIRCRVIVLTTLVGFVSLAGCGDPPPEQTTPAASKPPATPKTSELGSHMVAAVSAGKNSTAISVHFSLDVSPTVSTPLPVQIAIVPHQEFDSVRAHFEVRDGLSLPVGEDFGPANDVDPEKPLSHQLVLLPAREGMFMVTVGVETTGKEGNVVRIFSIPVIVGPAQAAPAPAPASAPASAPAPAEPAKQ
jgi:hypothetical protein